MPTYCAYTDLQYLTGSTLSQTILEAIITQAESKLDGMFKQANVTGVAGNATCQAAALELSIAGLLTRGRMDGTKPASIHMGDLSMSDDIDAAIAYHMGEAKRLVELYVTQVNGIAEVASSVDIDATVVMADHEMSDYNLDQTIVHEYHDQAGTYGNEDDEVY
jgi:hypothetical protein